MKSGEIVGIEWLYRQYDRSLRRFLARQRLSGDEVSDIAQEAYCRIHESANLAEIRNPRAFLFRVARNIWLNREKHRGKGIERGYASGSFSPAASLDDLFEQPGCRRSPTPDPVAPKRPMLRSEFIVAVFRTPWP